MHLFKVISDQLKNDYFPYCGVTRKHPHDQQRKQRFQLFEDTSEVEL